MPSGRPDFKKWTFRVNLAITGIVFFVMSPNVYIRRSWFPDKSESLWLYPLTAIFISAAVWFAVCLSIPALIRAGWLEELRQKGETGPRFQGWERYRKILRPIVLTALQLILMLLFSAAVIRFLETEPFKKLYTNLP